MQPGQRFRFLIASSVLAVLAACGGGGDGGGSASTPTGSATPTENDKAVFATDFGAGLNALKTYAGQTSAAFLDLFDDAFLDAGYTKAQVRNNLSQEAAATALGVDVSSFPGVTLSAVTITACDAANVCTLTATLTNADADTTTVSFTTRVSFSNSKFRLLGDQKQT
jgi:hypothetical protein